MHKLSTECLAEAITPTIISRLTYYISLQLQAC